MDSNCLSRWEVWGEALLFSFSSAPGNFLAPRRAYGADAHRCPNVFCPDILSIFGKVKALPYAAVKSRDEQPTARGPHAARHTFSCGPLKILHFDF